MKKNTIILIVILLILIISVILYFVTGKNSNLNSKSTDSNNSQNPESLLANINTLIIEKHECYPIIETYNNQYEYCEIDMLNKNAKKYLWYNMPSLDENIKEEDKLRIFEKGEIVITDEQFDELSVLLTQILKNPEQYKYGEDYDLREDKEMSTEYEKMGKEFNEHYESTKEVLPPYYYSMSYFLFKFDNQENTYIIYKKEDIEKFYPIFGMYELTHMAYNFLSEKQKAKVEDTYNVDIAYIDLNGDKTLDVEKDGKKIILENISAIGFRFNSGMTSFDPIYIIVDRETKDFLGFRTDNN